MITVTADSANDLFAATCREVLAHGKEVQPRGMATREVLGAHLRLTDPRRRFVDVAPRLLNPAFAVAEAVWILSGSDEPWIFDFNRNLARYADDGRLRGAYGPRIRRWRGGLDQLAHARDLLARDPDSRQAVVQIFDPELDTRGYRDVPCTLGYRFFIRAGRLHMHTSMRSNDVWLGLPYDLFTATLLHELMAGWLQVPLGDYCHVVDSLHLYAEHYEPAATVGADGVLPSPSMAAALVPGADLDSILAAVQVGSSTVAHGLWRTFATILDSYRHWRAGHPVRARAGLDPAEPLCAALLAWYAHLDARRTQPVGVSA